MKFGNLTILILAVLIVSLTVSAMDVQIPSEVKPNSNFFFTTNLNSSDSFDKIEVFLDNQKLLDAYSNLQIIPDPYNGNFIMKAFMTDSDPSSNSGLQLYVSHIGVKDGSHTVIMKSIKSGSVTEEKSSTFTAGEGNIEEIINQKVDTRLEGFEGTLTNFENSLSLFGVQYTLIKETFDSLQTGNSQLQNSLNAFQSELQNMQGSVSSLQNDLTGKVDSQKQEIEGLKGYQAAEVAKEEEAIKNNPFNRISGLATGTGIDGSQIGIGILVIVVIVIAAIVWKRRSSLSIYNPNSKNKFDSSDLEQQLVDQGSQQESEAPGLQTVVSSPKWKESKKEEEIKRFNLGDLVRK